MEKGKFVENLVDPDDILGSMGECNVFSFRARKGNDRLLLSTPRNGTETDEIGESRNGVAVTLIRL